MRYRFVVLFVVLLTSVLCQGQEYADQYPYASVCPKGYNPPDGVTKSDSIPGGIIFRGKDYWQKVYDEKTGIYLPGSSYWVDKWSFAQCNCTSYSAFMMSLYIPTFNNGYRGARWSNGGNWDDAARSIGIPVDRNPIPGDIAYWNTLGGVGHVAVVEKVHFDADGNKIGVDWTQYNNPTAYEWSVQTNRPITEPDGYIHILAYEEGVSSIHYMDCYEMSGLCDFQTPDEWEKILQSVAGYRCKDCDGEYQVVADAFYDGPVFGGGGSDGGSTPPPTTHKQPDLTTRMIVLDSVGKEINPITVFFLPGQSITPRVKLCTTEDVATFMGRGEESIATEVVIKIGDQTVTTYHAELTASLLDDTGDCIQETFSNFVVPQRSGQILCLTSKGDTEKDVAETNESNNTTDVCVPIVHTTPTPTNIEGMPFILQFLLLMDD